MDIRGGGRSLNSIKFLETLRDYLAQNRMRIFYTNLGKIEHGEEVDTRELLFRRGRRNAASAQLFRNPRSVLLCDEQPTKDKKPGHSYFVPVEYKRHRKSKYHRIIRDGESVRMIALSLGLGEKEMER